SAQYVIKSPAVPQTAPLLEEARNHNIPILTDVDIFFQELYATYAKEERPLIIGVTGTRGKSTTTTLIYELLRANGTSAVLGGNIGTSVLEVLPQLTSQTAVVLELSSFQL
ncbi:MAG: Mur ligase family protein, partial [Candidatus Paceibacteria bacterium]